ncbi:tetratricopeptide repeat protein [Helicobacter sp.]|uniref:tetratricopeptide repeat protein n=1 Tax=Helicobacter sp. TaxID=218 RepID=UPI0025B7F843|nr:tetratricopeptide repeat protein [Helicobacter sp.]MBR2494510.1 hypothetical protein [Helicobacter sp.]
MAKGDDKQIFTAIKQEFQQDERLLESAFKLEHFVKKYKYYLVTLVLVVLVWLGYVAIYDTIQENHAQKSSALYDELLQNPDNELLQKQLKEQARELYDLYQLSRLDLTQDVESILQELASSSNPLVKELASYDLASLKQQGLDKVSGELADLAAIQQAYLLLQEDKIQEARANLDVIKPDSGLYGIAMQMKHYGIVAHPLADTLTITEVQSPADSSQVDSTNAPKAQ